MPHDALTNAADWSARVGGVWAAEWRRTDRSFAGLSRHLDAAILAAAPVSGTVLDVGCGAGATSLALAAAAPHLRIVGVDVAPDLVAIARSRASTAVPEGAAVCFLLADISAGLPAMPPPGLIMSRHGVMFFDDPVATFSMLAAAAAPAANLVFSCFRETALNPWASDLVASVTGMTPPASSGYAPGPFAFADPVSVRSILEDAGWCDVGVAAVDYRYVAGAGADPLADAVAFLGRIGPIARALHDVDPAERPRLLDKLSLTLQKHRDEDEIAFPAAAWIWRARAPGEPP